MKIKILQKEMQKRIGKNRRRLSTKYKEKHTATVGLKKILSRVIEVYNRIERK